MAGALAAAGPVADGEGADDADAAGFVSALRGRYGRIHEREWNAR